MAISIRRAGCERDQPPPAGRGARHPQRVTSVARRLPHRGRMTDSGTAGPHPGSAAEAEVARLRAELARLRQEAARAHGRRRGWWRPVLAGFLVAVAALLAPLSVLATWASGQIEDTDRYVATVGPLANDPDVQKAIAARAEQVIFSYLDLDTAMDELDAGAQRPGRATQGGGNPAGRLGAPRLRDPELRVRPDPRLRAVGRLRAGLDRGKPNGPRRAGGRTDRQRRWRRHDQQRGRAV